MQAARHESVGRFSRARRLARTREGVRGAPDAQRSFVGLSIQPTFL
jgi:hypothetical protein